MLATENSSCEQEQCNIVQLRTGTWDCIGGGVSAAVVYFMPGLMSAI